jgi:hypothetical protein
MPVSAMLTSPSTESRRDRILALLVEHGRMTVADWTRRAMLAGIWSDDELGEATFQACKREIQEAARSKDRQGLPRAGRTGLVDLASQQEFWAQRAMWSVDAYRVNIDDRFRQRDGEHRIACLLRDECLDRYGCAPDVPPLPGDGAEAP